MMEQAKRIYINVMIKVNKLFTFFITVFSKRNRKDVLCVSIKLQKRMWKFERAMETLAYGSCSHNIPPTPKLLLPQSKCCNKYCLNKKKLHLCSHNLIVTTRYMFSISLVQYFCLIIENPQIVSLHVSGKVA